MKIAIGGSAANPVHYGHRELLERIIRLNEFNKVEWIVSGERPDKPGLPDSFHRWQMAKMLIKNSRVNLGYEKGLSTPTFYVIKKFQEKFPQAEIVWYCGSDHFISRAKFAGLCDVEAFWHEGNQLMERQKFLIIKRKGTEDSLMRYPKNFVLLEANIPEISSTVIRQRIMRGLDNAQYTSSEVLDYIKENQLYL